MKILFIGDIIGKTGRKTVGKIVPDLVRDEEIDFVIANGENAAGGCGLTPSTADFLFSNSIDVLTSGNHIWNWKKIYDRLDEDNRILRPANYPTSTPGVGTGVYGVKNERVGVLNLQGRVFMKELDSPFKIGKEKIQELKNKTNIIIVDFHAEATSEKAALGYYLDGSVSAVVGTHTHVQTSDERILPNKSAYITDAGMTGAGDSIIGMKKDKIIERFLTNLPVRFSVAKNDKKLEGVIMEINSSSGLSESIKRISVKL